MNTAPAARTAWTRVRVRVRVGVRVGVRVRVRVRVSRHLQPGPLGLGHERGGQLVGQRRAHETARRQVQRQAEPG
eukprot:scaffold21118_cov48-Phaeocystis_antarctica.AAC.2